MYGGGLPRFEFVRSTDAQADAIDAHRAAQRAAAPGVRPSARRRWPIPRACPNCPTRRAPGRSPTSPILPSRRGRSSADRTATAASAPPILHRLAGGGTDADVEAADRRRLRIVRRRRRPRVHDRAAARRRGRRRVRRDDRARALDAEVEGAIQRDDGRRRPARDADLARRPAVCTRRHRRVRRARRRDRTPAVAHEHPPRRRREQPAVGHGRVAAHRRRHRRRPARRHRTASRSWPTTASPASRAGRRRATDRRTRRRCSSSSPTRGSCSSSAARA